MGTTYTGHIMCSLSVYSYNIHIHKIGLYNVDYKQFPIAIILYRKQPKNTIIFIVHNYLCSYILVPDKYYVMS